jgi:hypothetical protein
MYESWLWFPKLFPLNACVTFVGGGDYKLCIMGVDRQGSLVSWRT